MALADSGSTTGTELNRALEVMPRAVTAVVDGLDALGLVRRVEHPSDRRATVIELTARGTRTGRDMMSSHRGPVDALLTDVSARPGRRHPNVHEAESCTRRAHRPDEGDGMSPTNGLTETTT